MATQDENKPIPWPTLYLIGWELFIPDFSQEYSLSTTLSQLFAIAGPLYPMAVQIAEISEACRWRGILSVAADRSTEK